MTGREVMAVVRWARESRRWESDLDDRRETWWVNCVLEVGALSVRDCWFRTIPLDLKLVSVKFSGLPFALPTFSLAFWKSFCFSFFFFELDPMVDGGWCGVYGR